MFFSFLLMEIHLFGVLVILNHSQVAEWGLSFPGCSVFPSEKYCCFASVPHYTNSLKGLTILSLISCFIKCARWWVISPYLVFAQVSPGTSWMGCWSSLPNFLISKQNKTISNKILPESSERLTWARICSLWNVLEMLSKGLFILFFQSHYDPELCLSPLPALRKIFTPPLRPPPVLGLDLPVP